MHFAFPLTTIVAMATSVSCAVQISPNDVNGNGANNQLPIQPLPPNGTLPAIMPPADNSSCSDEKVANAAFVAAGAGWLASDIGNETRANFVPNGCTPVMFAPPRGPGSGFIPRLDTGAVMYLCGAVDVNVTGYQLSAAANASIDLCGRDWKAHPVRGKQYRKVEGRVWVIGGVYSYIAGVNTTPWDNERSG